MQGHCILIISFLLFLVGSSAANSAIVIQSKTANAVSFTFSGVNAQNFDHYEVKVEDLIGNKVVFTQKYDKEVPVVVEQLEAEKSYMIVVNAFDRASNILAASVLPFDTFAERHKRDTATTTTAPYEETTPAGPTSAETSTVVPTTTTTTTTTTAAPTPIPVGSATFKVAAGVNATQSFILPYGVHVDIAVFAGAFAGPVTVSASQNTPNFTALSGFAATSMTFNVTVTDGSADAAAPADGFYITLSGGSIDQNSYLFVVVNKTLVSANTTCSANFRSYNKFKLTTKVCALGDFVVARKDESIKANCVSISPEKLIVGSYPVLDIDNTKYTNNTLFTSIVAPFVTGRTYSKLTTEGANSTICTMGASSSNNIWSQSFSACHDVLQLALKWTNHTICGFKVSQETSSTVEFKGKILLEYVDAVGAFSGVNVTRTTQHNYDIYISFQKNLVVTFSGLNVTSDVGIDIALTAEKYKAATGELTVELTTAVVWSYKLDNNVAISAPGGITVGNVSVDSTSCVNTAGTLCVQKLTFSLKLNPENTTCTFDGLYSVVADLVACRDSSSCSKSSIPFSFSLYSGPVCTSFTVKPVVTGTLQAYASASFGVAPITNFKLGDQVFFYVDVKAGTGNTVNIKFTNIGFDDGTGAGFKYLLSGGSPVAEYSAVSLQKFESSNYFSLYLTGSVFKIPYEQMKSYVFNATVELLFDGNTKRTIETSYKVNGHINALTRVYIEPADELWSDDETGMLFGSDDEVEAEVADSAPLPVVIGAVVGVVAFNVLVSMLVIAFYKKMTNQHRYAQVSQTPVA